ncbi:hypothetical protein HAHE_11500 [Haloferula helveola]|uniref:Uncharacterized protein n=1 Tax=Haloferula helveola TaxID=490095 RepID=A0ABM7RAD2_9BACT|nr:hypothetical protein HAHE_11500 [Haloferula helveola]
MQTVVQSPDADASLTTVKEVVSALKKEKLEPSHEAKNWGDWIHIEGCDTVISIESLRGLTGSATIEHAEDERNDPTQAILRAFHQLGWEGVDEDGPYPLG